jgi:hypothetical protein
METITISLGVKVHLRPEEVVNPDLLPHLLAIPIRKLMIEPLDGPEGEPRWQ